MQMTKELEKRLKVMQRFNQVRGDKRYTKERICHNKIFVHNDIMYATDGNIFVAASNLTDRKDFSFFRCSGRKFEYLDSSVQEVKEDGEALRNGEAFEKVLQPLNCASVSFDIDFEGYPLPVELCSSWSKRYEDKMQVNFQTGETVIDFCGGSGSPEGVTGSWCYGAVIKNASGTIPENPLHFAFWHIREIMKQCKVNKVHVESYPDRKRSVCKAGDYTFIFMLYDD